MAHDVWEQDYKVLDAAVTYFTFTSPQGPANADEVARVLGEVSEDWDVSVARQYAAKPPFLVPDFRWDYPEVTEVTPPSGVTERGLRVVGAWPSEAAAGEALVAALREAIARTEDPVEKSKLERLLDAAGSVGTSVLGGVLTAAGTTVFGLS